MNPLRDLYVTDLPWWILVIRAAAVYIAILLLLRLAGKRQVAQMGMGELVALLLISNAVQNAMNGGDNSLIGGVILAAVLITLSTAYGYLTYRSSALERVLQGRPALLIHHGRILKRNCAHELLNTRELQQMLRKQGIHDLADVEEAVLESDGSLSVVRKSEAQAKGYERRADVEFPENGNGAETPRLPA